MSLNFKKIQILSDFNLNFEMFNLSKKIQKNLSKLLNINIIFQFVNFNRPNQKYNAEIYWGTRPNNTLIKKIYGLKKELVPINEQKKPKTLKNLFLNFSLSKIKIE